jgi:hypothetical protein
MANATQLNGAANGSDPNISVIADTDANRNLPVKAVGTGYVGLAAQNNDFPTLAGGTGTVTLGVGNGTTPSTNVNIVATPKGSGNVQIPTGGLALQGGGHLTSAQATAPTVAVGAAAGTGSASITAGSTDQRGQISVTVTGGTATGVLATITFGTAFPGTPFPTFSPANAAAAALSTTEPFMQGDSTTTATLRANGAALANGTYVWNWVIVG